MTEAEIAWLAGLLEGEGCFRLSNGRYPSIWLGMTDEDVVRKAATFLQSKVYITLRKVPRKTVFTAFISGARARDLMKELLPYMGERRSAKITEVLLAHEQRTFKGRRGRLAWNAGTCGVKSKLSSHTTNEIRRRWIENPLYGMQSSMAREYGVTPARVRQICLVTKCPVITRTVI